MEIFTLYRHKHGMREIVFMLLRFHAGRTAVNQQFIICTTTILANTLFCQSCSNSFSSVGGKQNQNEDVLSLVKKGFF